MTLQEAREVSNAAIVALLRFILAVSGGVVVGCISWCLLDYILVKYAPSHINDFDWTCFLFLFFYGLLASPIFPERKFWDRFFMGLCAAFVAGLFVAVLIFIFGVPFHWAIGGKL